MFYPVLVRHEPRARTFLTQATRLRTRSACLVLMCLLDVAPAHGSTRYHVRMRPQEAVGLKATMSFELTSSDVNTNTVRIIDFAHDGTAQAATWQGGPVFGDLLDAANPADTTTIEDQGFYARVAIPFDALGSQITFTTDLTEAGPSGQGPPDEVAFFILRSSDQMPYTTADDLGAEALFVVDVTGAAGGELSVYSPMNFVPPDSLILDGAIVGVPPRSSVVGRLSFRRLGPNPSRGSLDLTYEVPAPGGPLGIKVFDVAGRLVATPYFGMRAPGVWTTRWDGADSGGHALSSGVYIVQLQMAGQSLVRRVVLAR